MRIEEKQKRRAAEAKEMKKRKQKKRKQESVVAKRTTTFSSNQENEGSKCTSLPVFEDTAKVFSWQSGLDLGYTYGKISRMSLSQARSQARAKEHGLFAMFLHLETCREWIEHFPSATLMVNVFFDF